MHLSMSSAMRIFRVHEDLVVLAPAKVNLFLEVLNRRTDGYHEIATLMIGLRFHDVLRFAADDTGEVGLTCNRPELTGPDNLVVRAARLLQERTGCTRGVRIRLTKRIPAMAGLAGGSTDAVATLVALNRLWNLGRSPAELAEWSTALGSDLAFFFALPAACCTGRGENVRPVPTPKPLDLVLVCPPFGCSTPEVYRRVELPQSPEKGERIVAALGRGDLQEVGRLLHNRLEPAAAALAPELTRLLRRIAAERPLGQRMSGSGSTLFALCRNRAEARRIAHSLRRDSQLEGCKVFAVRTSTSSS